MGDETCVLGNVNQEKIKNHGDAGVVKVQLN